MTDANTKHLTALIDRIEGVFGWANCRNDRDERLKDDPAYVAAYLAARAATTITTQALADVGEERARQINAEGWTPEHDDQHHQGELGLAAALYALPYESGVLAQDDIIRLDMLLDLTLGWNLEPEPDRRKRLVKAGALTLAEIERLDRETVRSPS